MGTKGRDAALWLFFALMLASILVHAVSKVLFLAALPEVALFLRYCAREHPKAVRRSGEMGLRLSAEAAARRGCGRARPARLRPGSRRAS